MDATEEFNRDIARARRIKDQIKALEGEYDQIMEKYTFAEEGTIPAGEFGLQVTRTRRFDAATAKRNLPADLYQQTLVTKPDSTKAKKVLTDEQYRMAQRDYGWTRKIIRYDEEG